MHAKLGGTNWLVNLGIWEQDLNTMCEKDDAVMFIGADIYHPPPGARENRPSVAGVKFYIRDFAKNLD